MSTLPAITRHRGPRLAALIVALGASVLGMFAWSHLWIYLLAELVAGGAAAGVFLLTQLGEKVTGQMRAAEPGAEAGPRALDGTAHPATPEAA